MEGEGVNKNNGVTCGFAEPTASMVLRFYGCESDQDSAKVKININGPCRMVYRVGTKAR